MKQNLPTEPVLDPPGRGLPWAELWIARLMVGWKARRTTRAAAAALFANERERIIRLTKIDESHAGQRVLISRPRGLEDSSRFWSILMTLDHLRIVNEMTADVIAALARGEQQSRVVGTADVKPSPLVDRSVIDQFVHACDQFETTVAAIADLRTKLRWPHPWFGPLDAERWHFFTAFHMRMHRRQIETIGSVLAASKT